MPAWVLVCNPAKFDLVGMRRDGKKPQDWTIGRYRGEISPGEPFALWLTGSSGGIAAIGEIAGAPYEANDSADADYWTDPPTGQRWVVPILITSWVEPVLPRDTVRGDGLLAGATLLTQPFASNPHRLSETQWHRLMTLVTQSGQSLVTKDSDQWQLEPGHKIRRVELHERYGGSGQGGISPSRSTPNILIFTDPSSGHEHGYYDEWAEDGTFHYTGEGQAGDQAFVRGNKAIRDHVQDGRALRLFEGSRGEVRYVGEFVLDPTTPWSYGRAPETGGGPERQVIRFHMLRIGTPVLRPEVPVGVGYREADEDVVPVPTTPVPNTELNGRNLRAHRRLQNLLASELRARGIEPLSPGPADPDFDLAWHPDANCLTVCEIKSLTRANEINQLRLGLGQVLDYVDQLGHRAERVLGVLWIEREPSDDRWIALCQRAGIRLAWPGLEQEITRLKK
ncbi:hypothetical protein B0I32_1317 [Nonomuraea fuscirosea]|uniref:ScoMcrA-like SRA domain-containing protein n=2 Tax=Nonomuraea fuscirosea TaxID=1291556 RepID=A0A2T0M5A6_9ACTN|nr:hypothetical protein B0I32_1317 [Nonomuraea fuscirosea]